MPTDLDSNDLERILGWARVVSAGPWKPEDSDLYHRLRAMLVAAKTREWRDEVRQETQYGSEES